MYPATPGSQNTDTSRGAAVAAEPTADSIRGLCLDALKTYGPMTADETAERVRLHILTVRPRMTELHQLQLTRDTGLRRKNASGRPAIVWEPKPATPGQLF